MPTCVDHVHFKTALLSPEIASSEKVKQVITKESVRNDQKLLEIFPEEIWLMILRKIEESEFLEDVANASHYFRTLLEPRRVKYLLPNVLPVIVPTLGFPGQEGSFYRRPNERWNHRVPSFLHLLPMRLVCRCWQVCVDHFLATHRLHSLTTEGYNGNCPKSHDDWQKFEELMHEYTFRDCFSFNKPYPFLQHFQTTHAKAPTRCPFIGKTVWFKDQQHGFAAFSRREMRNQCTRLQNEFTYLLSLYGHHVWNCSLEVWNSYPTKRTRLDYLKRILHWLELMPNLRVLEIKVVSFGSSSEDFQEIERLLAIKLFPKLQHLQLLTTEHLPAPIFHNLLACNADIASWTGHIGYKKQ